MKKFKRMLSSILAVSMVIGGVPGVPGVPGAQVPMAVQAAVYNNTSNIDLVNEMNQGNVEQVTGDRSGTGWFWNNADKVLTLEDGFQLHIGNDLQQAALKLKADTTILLKGTAEIETNQKGIEVLGNLTIKSAEGTNGYLKINLNQKGTNGNYNYGVEIKNPEGKTDRELMVTDHTIVEISGGDKCIMCSAGDDPSNNKAALSITEQSVVQLRNDTSIADGFQISNSERIIWIDGNTDPTLLKEQETMLFNTQTDLTMMSCRIAGKASEDKKTYTLTYDGEEHPVLVNTDEDTLAKLGHSVKKIRITPEDFTYYETKYSEYLNEENSDYRDKEPVATKTQYEWFTAAKRAPKDAAKYTIAYGNDADNTVVNLVTLDIQQREVTVEGLKAKDKTYDGWADAEIDYSDMKITCVNDTNEGTADKTGIVDADQSKLGKEIVPYAKAYYLAQDGDGSSENNPFGDGQNYKRSADVAYTGTGTSAQKKVAEKIVMIDNGTDKNGIATGISLSDPNYKVVPPSANATPTSQLRSTGSIYPRALTDKNITAKLDPDMFKWSEEGYSEVQNIRKSVKDASLITPNHPELLKELTEGTDYIVNPNTNTITEVGQYEIILTGQENYTGTIRLNWSIDRAVRKITIAEPRNRAYNGVAYEVTAGKNSSGFWYTVEDTDNQKDVTDTLEEGSNLKITYQGVKADGTEYPKSLTAPKDAGTYTVTISVDTTTRYTAAETSLEYTILPKTVEVVWYCEGGSVDEKAKDPKELVYNGTKNTFHAEVSNAVEGDTVKVTEIVYDGTTTGGKNYNSSKEVPYEAGTYTVRAVKLDNTNYTLEGNDAHAEATPGHPYTVKKAPVWLTWEADKAVYVYDAKDHTPTATIHGLCKNEDGTEDNCKVNAWSFEGTDVFGNGYTQTGTNAVNVSEEGITITATGLDNPNYELVEGEGSRTAEFTIIPRDLSTLEVGTAEDHKEIWADKLTYRGEVLEPTIKWFVENVGETLKLDKDYTASLSTKAMEYNKNGLNIEIVGKGNYKGETIIPWNVDKISCAIKVKNAVEYENITYGKTLPSFEVDYEDEDKTNEDIAKNYADNINNHLTYRYTGTMKNGKEYDSDQAPTQAGKYEITVTLEETAHYWEAETKIPLTIKQREVTVTGIEALSKQYDGNDVAVLDFSKSEWDNLASGDETTIEEEIGKVTDPAKGYITYEASFKDANVSRSTDYARTVIEQEVAIKNCAIQYEGSTPDIFYNYVIAKTGNQETAQAKIEPKKVSISGIKAKDKVYNGSKEAELDLKNIKIQGIASGEELDVKVKGEFTKTGDETSEKDVRMESGKPAAKTVTLVYDSLIAGNVNTRIDNYMIDLDKGDIQKETTAVISPATLTIKGVKAVDKTFDNKADVKLDWEAATIEGICADDVIILSEANGKDWASDRYADANVEYDKNGNVINKTGTIAQSKYQVQLKGEYEATDYVVDTIVFQGKVNPKTLKGITWTFDETGLGQLPEAVFDKDCGALDEDSCEPVVRYYLESDPTKEITRAYMVDNENYVARVVDVRMTGDTVTKTNYCIDENDSDLTYSFRYEESADSSDLEITNYQRVDGTAYTITYGDKLPMPTLKYTNSDIEKEDAVTKAKHFTYLYTGKALNGKSYESDQAPTDAGSYKVTVTLEETEHFQGSEAKANFVIAPASVKIIQGVSVEDKRYNGTDKAILDFKNVVFDGVIDRDEKEIQTLFAENKKDYIRYTASYAQKDVLWTEKKAKEEGQVENAVAYIDVTAGNFSFILNNETPDVLYNYMIAKDGNQSKFSGRIQPRMVTVSGIRAKDKTYDGTDIAVLDLSDIEFAGRLKGETLTADVSGVYEVTGEEAKAKDVLLNEEGKAQGKKITLNIKSLAAGDETTVAGNYILAEDGQQTEVAAKILPAAIRIQSGLTAQDKVYNGTTAAELNFDEVVWDGVVKADEKELKAMLAGDAKEFISYDADYAQKDVNWETGETGAQNVAEIAVTAGRYGFILNGTTPQLLKDYVIDQEDSQAELTGMIRPRTVTVSGIKAKDKIYDGTDEAVLDLSGIEFAGRLKGENLTADVSGVYEVSGGEAKAKDVLLNEEGKAQEKTITLNIKGIAAGDEITEAGNYILAEEGQQTEATAKILPAAIRIQSGLTVQDKVYNGTTAAELNFDGAVWDGVVKADEEELKALLAGEGKEYIVYDADYAQKDVNWEISEDGKQNVSEVVVTAGRYGFILNGTTPQLLKDYVIDQEGSQTALAGMIQPRTVTVSGIKAKDKTYDGTDEAVLDLSGIEFAGRLKGETLTADVSGAYELTEGEAKAKDVLLNEEGRAQEKKITLNIKGIAAGDETTVAGNYVLADEGQQTEVEAKILPAAIRIQSGLTAQDKVYNGTTVAELNFDGAVWDGVIKADEEALKALLAGEGKEYIAYDADYAQKDVNWETGEDGKKKVSEVAVTASRYGFILNGTTPQLLKDYVIDQEGSQTALAGMIRPRTVTISGIKAKDKTYDGTDTAVLDLSGIEFAGRLKGDVLTAEVSGAYMVTGKETKAGDVLSDQNGKAQEKKIALNIKGIAVGDDSTIAGNYILAEEGQQKETTAKILPAELKSVVWSFDTKEQLPKAEFTEKEGIIGKDTGSSVVRIYEKNDTEYKNAVSSDKMTKGDIYVARVEGYTNANYTVSEKFTNPVYTFAYGTKSEEIVTTEQTEKEPTPTEQVAAVRAMNKGLSLSWKNKKLTFKWGKVSGADGYLVYTGITKNKYNKGVEVVNNTSYKTKAENKNKTYKAYVKAYKVVNGKKVVIGKSLVLYCAGSGKDGYNAKKVTVKKKSIKLAVDKTVGAKASVSVKKSGKTVKKTGKSAHLRYWSTNPDVASVSATGEIRGVKKGTCYVYVMARNGLKKRIKVTVG